MVALGARIDYPITTHLRRRLDEKMGARLTPGAHFLRWVRLEAEPAPKAVAASIAEVAPDTKHRAALLTASDATLDPHPAALARAVERAQGRATAQLVAGVATELVETTHFNERRDGTREACPGVDLPAHALHSVGVERNVAEVERVHVRADVGHARAQIEIQLIRAAGAEADLALGTGTVAARPSHPRLDRAIVQLSAIVVALDERRGIDARGHAELRIGAVVHPFGHGPSGRIAGRSGAFVPTGHADDVICRAEIDAGLRPAIFGADAIRYRERRTERGGGAAAVARGLALAGQLSPETERSLATLAEAEPACASV